MVLLGALALSPIAVACSGAERAPTTDGALHQPTTSVEGCETGETQKCSITLEQANGVLSCYQGTQTCIQENVWGPCTDGDEVTLVDPSYHDEKGARVDAKRDRESFALSSAVDCVGNPCDPSCQYWLEPGPFTSGTGSGATGPLPDWSTTTTPCAHQLCDVDTVALDANCHPCVASVCSTPGLEYCCTGSDPDSWDEDCVEGVYLSCQSSPPTESYELCEYSIWGDETIDLDNATSYPGSIGASDGVALSSGITVDNVITEADIHLSNASTFGTVYSTGAVTLASGPTVGQIVAGGSVTLNNAATVGAGGIWSMGDVVSGASNWVVSGDVTAVGTAPMTNGDCNLTNGSTITGTVNCARDLTINSSNLTVDAYAGRNIEIQNQSQPTAELHLGGNLTFTGSDGRSLGDTYVGTDVIFSHQGNRVGGDLHVQGDVACSTSTGDGADGTAWVSGSVTGTCNIWGGGPNTGASAPDLIAPTPPTLPAIPPPPKDIPRVDALRRETATVCAQAAAATDITTGSHVLYPGVYGDINVPNGQTFTLAQPGTYVFNSYTSGSGVPFNFDGGGPWEIVVCDSFALKNASDMIDLGTGVRVASELVTIYSARDSEGSSTCSLANWTNCCIYSESNTELSGVLIAPDCDIAVTNGTTAEVVTWGNNIYTGSSVSYLPVPIADCNSSSLEGSGTSCGTIELYTTSDIYTLGSEVAYNGQRYVCTDAALCDFATVKAADADPSNYNEDDYWDDYWPGEGTNWASAWDRYDDCPAPPSIPTSVDTSAMCPVTIPNVTVLDYDVSGCSSAADCQVNSTCTEVTTEPECSHSVCVSGEALGGACETADLCVQQICAADPSCCSTHWDQSACADRVEELCAVECGATMPSPCPHNACEIGVALHRSCSPTVEAVCDNDDADCCDGTASDSWDQDCIDYLTTRLTGSPTSTVPVNSSTCDFAIANGANQLSANGATINGSVYAATDIWGNGIIDGDALAQGTIGHTGVNGAEDDTLTSTPYPVPTWAGVVPDAGCDDVAPGGSTWPAPGYYWGLSAGNTTFPDGGGDYYIRGNLLVNHSASFTLPSDGAPVNIYICGTGSAFQLSGNNTITSSPLTGPSQLGVFVQNGAMTFGNPSTVDGFFASFGNNANISANATVNGVVHTYSGTVNIDSSAVVNFGPGHDFDRTVCLNRGFDGNNSPPVECPTDDSPAQDSTVTEGGICRSNVDMGGSLITRSDCSDVDLALDTPCDDTYPVCNLGGTDLLAGEAEIVFYPRQTAQFATTSADPFFQDPTTCPVTVGVPSGSCVDIACPAFSDDMTARVEMTSAATQIECQELDNWTYAPQNRSCSTSTTETVTEVYQATCPSEARPAWGLLAWNTTLEGDATVDFEARTSADGANWGTSTPLGQAAAASSTEVCSFVNCAVDVGSAFYPGVHDVHDEYLELTITLTPDGGDAATLSDWRLTYSCIEDQ